MTRLFVTSPTGGSGCSTISANLASTFARLGRTVLLAGEEETSLSMHFDGLTTPGRSSARINTKAGVMRTVAPGLHLRSEEVASGNSSPRALRPMPRDAVDQQRYPEYDMEIYDRLYVPSREDMTDSDWVLVVAQSSAYCYRQLAGYLDSLSGYKSAFLSSRIITVVNSHLPESQLSADILDLMVNDLGDFLYPGVFLFDELVRESAASGLPLVEYAPYSGNQPLFEQLANHIASSNVKPEAAA